MKHCGIVVLLVLVNSATLCSTASSSLVQQVEAAVRFWDQKEAKFIPSFRQQYDVLPKLINQHKLQRGCQVGVAFGTQSLEILSKSQLKVLYDVDPYRPYGPDPLAELANEQLTWDVLCDRVKRRLTPFGDHWSFIRKPSMEAVEQFKDGELCFVYIDGDHSYESVKNDLRVWWSKIRPGGFLVCDDYYTKRWVGLQRAIDEFTKEHNLKMTRAGVRMVIMRKPA